MTDVLRLSEHPRSQQWLAQMRTAEDRGLASQLLNALKLVSLREFESGLEQALVKLQGRLKATLAVYPVAPSGDPGIAGYAPFTGGIAVDHASPPRRAGKRRQYGSEDRVGHLLAKIQNKYLRPGGTSEIECGATLNQIETQGIRHIVLVDDLCGSGIRINDYWSKVVPRRIKSLLSLKKCDLWIIVYAITPSGIRSIRRGMPNFPMKNLISILPSVSIDRVVSGDVVELCVRYGEWVGMPGAGLGYRQSACPVVFEHGCPNNAPAFLWRKTGSWNGLFANNSIPDDMRTCFDQDGIERAIEFLWNVNQRGLAISLLDALDRKKKLSINDRMLLTLLGLRLRGVSERRLAAQLQMSALQVVNLLNRAVEMGLYISATSEVTRLGQAFVARFRARSAGQKRSAPVGRNPSSYYPTQCEGEISNLAKPPV